MTAAAYLTDGRVPQRGSEQLTGKFVCYLPYEAADGWVTMGALEPKFWAKFCQETGHPELIERQFESPGSDAWAEVAAIFRSKTKDEWRAFNDQHDAMVEPVLDLDEALESELVRAREMVVEIDQPEIGPVKLVGAPVKMSRTAADPTRPAPALGEHTEAVLAEAGFAAEDIAALLEAGAAAGMADEAQPARFMG
jgi:alpha-methylacyl-CoA racemase